MTAHAKAIEAAARAGYEAYRATFKEHSLAKPPSWDDLRSKRPDWENAFLASIRVFLLACEASEGMLLVAIEDNAFDHEDVWRAMASKCAEEIGNG